jgi:hypothetical protein
MVVVEMGVLQKNTVETLGRFFKTLTLTPNLQLVLAALLFNRTPHVGVSENVVYPIYPMVLLIIIPIKWLFHWEYTQHFQTNLMLLEVLCRPSG